MNFRYYNSSNLVILILILIFLISPLSACIEKKISEYEDLNILYGYVGIFSTVTILTGVLLLIDRFLWRFSLFNWLIDVPNLNGRYEGELTSSFIDPSTNLPTVKKCVMEISQNASKICVHSYYGDIATNNQTSQGFSLSEEIVKNNNGIFEVFYIFSNTPNALINQLHHHLGTSNLKYFPDIKVLEGEYFNQRGLKGTIKVSFVQKETVGRFII
ncbi:Cap15 family cyclic dinucleotide receptor domain-containing protein [Flavobacterium selenitireducens]|uniref:Cap15 family cyclic dinucleotide receptor domain-containing protein n=1 Tax=Flavobacterium selenitireducens TaxID=2722704 RepID=UPI00168B4997|nr:hypothetical protein [Flavobacterium selenitireducens]MBD3584025.1 hypothetical protein [Flavobacterium selenitireducens]